MRQGKLAARNSRGGRQSRFCLRVELVQRQTVMHYQAARSRAFLRIVVATPNLVAQARGARPGFLSRNPRFLRFRVEVTWSRRRTVRVPGSFFSSEVERVCELGFGVRSPGAVRTPDLSSSVTCMPQTGGYSWFCLRVELVLRQAPGAPFQPSPSCSPDAVFACCDCHTPYNVM